MLSKKKIAEYRRAAKKIGIWDKDYQSIKNDMNHIVDEINARDFAMDLVGGSLEQIILVFRLITYGESDSDLSDEDLKVLMAPTECFESLFLTPYMLRAGIDNAVDDMLPLVCDVMKSSKDINEFKSTMRHAIAGASKITDVALTYSISLGICFRKYKGARDHIKPLVAELVKMLKNSEFLDKTLKMLDEEPDEKEDIHTFPALLASAIIECNMGKNVSFGDLYMLISRISDISKESEMHDFITSDDFKFLMRNVENYYDISS